MYSRLRVCCSQSIGSATVAAFVGARRLSEQSGTGMVRTTTTTGLNLGFQKNRVVYAAAVAAAAAAVAASAAAAAAEGKDDPAFHFGLIADVQYADVENRYNFGKTQIRLYRGAVKVLKNAVDAWRSGPALKFIGNLGDTIDQLNHGEGTSQSALRTVMAEFERCPAPVAHAMGNHELYNFSREELKLHFGEPYYSFKPEGSVGWRIVLLDSYDLNCIDTVESDDTTEEAYDYLAKHNPNELRVRGTVDWKAGLEGRNMRFVPFNGGIRPAQLAWLRKQLQEAESAKERVIVLAHVPIAPGSAQDVCLAWNYAEVLGVLDEHPLTVAAVFTGHDHAGGKTTRKGVHFVCLPSPLHAGPEVGELAHSTVAVHADRLVLHNKGFVAKQLGGDVLNLPFPSSSSSSS